MSKRRFEDRGRWLAEFAGEFLVRCPRCDAAAVVSRERDFVARRWLSASVACTSCGFSRRDPTLADWAGPVDLIARPRCGGCGRRICVRRQTSARPYPRVLDVTCDGCGTTTTSAAEVHPVEVPRALVDECFGLSLALQTPCAGHTLWAYNRRHLAYVKEFLAADLRERRTVVDWSIASRLPGWLKSAKHRGEALRAVARLENPRR